MTYVGNFTLIKDEAFGDYHIDTSQKLTRHIRATWKLQKTVVNISAKLFKKKTGGVHRRTKNQLHAGRVWKVGSYGKIKIQLLGAKKVTKKDLW